MWHRVYFRYACWQLGGSASFVGPDVDTPVFSALFMVAANNAGFYARVLGEV